MPLKTRDTSDTQRAASPNAGRRLFLFGLPAAGFSAGFSLLAAGSAKGAEPGTDESGPSDQPTYSETDLVRRYYQRARF